MSLPSLDPTQSLDLPAQPPPLMPASTLPTPMDTTPSPNVISSLPNTNTMQTMQLGNVLQASNATPTLPTIPATPIQPSVPAPPVQSSIAAKSQAASSSTANTVSDAPAQLLSKARLQDLVREIDPNVQLDDEVEELLMQLADDFVETAVNSASLLAKHRKASTIDVKDVQLHLERNWNMWIPGFGNDEIRPFKRAAMTEAHKQRLALIRKALKKY
ncbi:transcription initiation factor TFIID subunit 12-like [Thrips palmi]|uniref:Transcription initiation factor TFIID subunit 12 n=1 Tax=Thrips palmi TaxID=161013 RepID=A0A6P9A679_THRPL|nr:transcription initiation factor TFIID subunit 12-like [Thrips palmi]XP_034253468.1 transcription initiation factor TFIID subunit 12-like [Thrips palmi]